MVDQQVQLCDDRWWGNDDKEDTPIAQALCVELGDWEHKMCVQYCGQY